MKVTPEQILAVIKKSDITSAKPEALVSNISLRQQGVDSLEMAAIFFNIEDAFKVTIPHTDYEKLNSVDEIVAYLNQRS